MKKTAILALFILISFDGIGQDTELLPNKKYLEYHRGLKQSVADSARAFYLSSLGSYYKFVRPDSGIYYATKGFELAKKTGNKRMELWALGSLASSHGTLGNSITAYRIALERLREVEEYNPDLKGESYRILGIIMRSSKKISEAQEYYEKARNEFFRRQSLGPLATIYAELGLINSQLGNIDSAFYYGYKGISLADSLKAPVPMDVAYDRMGDIHYNFQKFDSALYYYKISYTVRSENRRSPYVFQKLANLYSINGQPDSALYYADEALNRALANKLYEDVSESALLLSDFYEKKDPSKAITYYKLALTYQDSLDYVRNMTGFADLTSFDELLRQSELERANEAYQSKLRSNTFIGSIITLLIIAFFLYRNNRAKNKSKLQIEGAYNQLKATQSQLIHAEKMASLGELTAGIAHEIQNPLNFVNNFSEVSSELLDEMKEELQNGDLEEVSAIAEDLRQNLEKITHHGKRADSIVKGMLQHSRSGDGTKEPTDLNNLVDEYLRLAYHGIRAKNNSFNATLDTVYDDSIGKVTLAPQEMGRVLLNLITNAFYAVDERKEQAHEGYQPMVSVKTKASGNRVEITVRDNGKGIPEEIKDKIFQPFFTTKPTGQGTGLGLSLSYDIVKAHGGEIAVASKEGEGTEFTIKLPAE